MTHGTHLLKEQASDPDALQHVARQRLPPTEVNFL